MSLTPGTRLGAYEIQSALGAGGIGRGLSRAGYEAGSRRGDQDPAGGVQSGTTLVAGREQMLFEFAMTPIFGGNRTWDLAPDGRFVIIRSGLADEGGSAPSNLILVLNWFEELKRLVPVN